MPENITIRPDAPPGVQISPSPFSPEQDIQRSQQFADYLKQRGLFEPPASPVSSTAPIRDAQDETKAAAADLGPQIDDLEDIYRKEVEAMLARTTFGETEAGKEAAARLEEMRKALGILTPGETSEVEAAGRGAEAEFAPIIAEAERAKEQGLPKALIGAGERGGLMNTQFAGVAALTPTVGGDFFGAGGKLEELKSVYDVNISNLKAQRTAAIEVAKSAARKAIRTGKRDDYDLALRAMDAARAEHEKAKALSDEKLDAITRFQEQKRKAKAAPIEVSPGASLLDPVTGDVIGTAPPKPEKAEDQVKQVGNYIIKFNSETQTWDVVFDAREQNRLLTVEESGRLGVPFGTTVDDIKGKNIVPKFGKGTGTSSGGGTGASVNPEIDTLAEAYLRGESLGQIGATKKAQVIARSKELQKEQVRTQLGTPEAVATAIGTALDAGEGFESIRKDLVEELGIPEELYKQALQLRLAQPERAEVQSSFFGRLFSK